MTADLIHGGALDHMRAAFPDSPEPWIDLSTGINPWPWHIDTLPNTSFHHLPTRTAYNACRKAMANSFGAPQDSLVLAPGSELLIRLLPWVIGPDRVAVLEPTYSDHAQVWQAAGCEVIRSENPLTIADEVDAVVVCNPNNPDGQRFQPAELLSIAEMLARRGGWLIVDEAYADLDPSLSLAPYAGHDGLILLRSFGKFFGLAGVRLGALIAPPAICSAMQDQLGTWPVSGPALQIGARAYDDQVWQSEIRQQLRNACQRLDAILARAGLTVAGGTDLFRLVDTENANVLWDKLGRAGIYVRRFDQSDRLIRIGLPATDSAAARLAAALNP